jgi:hypothetical protein
VTYVVIHWITLIILWALIIQNWRIMRRYRRWRMLTEKQAVEQMAQHLGVTPLQVQVALDASHVVFEQRVREMGGHHDCG